jgi:hypothetical protein
MAIEIKPNIETGDIDPITLSVSTELLKNNPPPFGVNPDFLKSVQTYIDSRKLSPLLVYNITGEAKLPDLNTEIPGYEYTVKDDTVYVIRRAPDCGEGEFRTEELALGQRSELYPNSFLFYGNLIPAGTQAQGGGG